MSGTGSGVGAQASPPYDFDVFLRRVRDGAARVGDRFRLVGARDGIARVDAVLARGEKWIELVNADARVRVTDRQFQDLADRGAHQGDVVLVDGLRWEVVQIIDGPDVSVVLEGGAEPGLDAERSQRDCPSNFWKKWNTKLRHGLGEHDRQLFDAHVRRGLCLWKVGGAAGINKRWRQIVRDARRRRARLCAETPLGDAPSQEPDPAVAVQEAEEAAVAADVINQLRAGSTGPADDAALASLCDGEPLTTAADERGVSRKAARLAVERMKLRFVRERRRRRA